MNRKLLDINDYQNPSDEFKRDVAFANAVLNKVYAKINEQSQAMLNDVVRARLNTGFVHSTENVAKPKSKLLLIAKAKALKSLRLEKNKVIVIKNKSN